MAEPVRARRLSDEEGRRLLQIVRRGKHGSVRVRRAMIIMASASGTLVPAIARLVAADEDTVRDVIHTFNAKGLAALDPQWAGGRPRLISDEDIEVILTAARTGPEKLGQPFTRWSQRKLAAYLAEGSGVGIGRERLRQILHARGPPPADRTGRSDAIRTGRQAGPDRVHDQPFPGPVRSPSTTSGRCPSAMSRHLLGAAQTPGPAARRPPPHPRYPVFPRLLRHRR